MVLLVRADSWTLPPWPATAGKPNSEDYYLPEENESPRLLAQDATPSTANQEGSGLAGARFKHSLLGVAGLNARPAAFLGVGMFGVVPPCPSSPSTRAVPGAQHGASLAPQQGLGDSKAQLQLGHAAPLRSSNTAALRRPITTTAGGMMTWVPTPSDTPFLPPRASSYGALAPPSSGQPPVALDMPEVDDTDESFSDVAAQFLSASAGTNDFNAWRSTREGSNPAGRPPAVDVLGCSSRPNADEGLEPEPWPASPARRVTDAAGALASPSYQPPSAFAQFMVAHPGQQQQQLVLPSPAGLGMSGAMVPATFSRASTGSIQESRHTPSVPSAGKAPGCDGAGGGFPAACMAVPAASSDGESEVKQDAEATEAGEEASTLSGRKVTSVHATLAVPISRVAKTRPAQLDEAATAKAVAKALASPKKQASRKANNVGGTKRLGQRVTCRNCGAQQTPQWRCGPEGPRTLCNACGVRYKKGLPLAYMEKKRKAGLQA